MRTLSVVALTLVFWLLQASLGVASDDVRSIPPAALSDRVSSGRAPIILDVRTPAEFASGHIPGAINIPHTELAGRISELDPEAEIALYCMAGPRARLGEQTLQKAGRTRLLHVQGGLSAWMAAGLPVEK